MLKDQVGSARLAIRVSDGAIGKRADYDEYGAELLNTAGDFTFIGHAGGMMDLQTGLTRFGLREYDAQAGRWTSKDPIRFGGKSFGLYEHVNSDPINGMDPSGLKNVVAWLVELANNGYRKIGGLSFDEAIRALREGEDILARNRKTAEEIARGADPHGRPPVCDPAHTGATNDPQKRKPHYHPYGRPGGHVFWEWLLALLDANGDGTLDDLDVFEFANPLPIPFFVPGGPEEA